MSRKILILSILSVFLNISCVTQRKCLLKFPIDTVRTVTTIYRDTIIPVYIPKTDTVYKWGTLTDTVYASSGTAKAKTYIVRDTLRLMVWQTDSTYMFKLDSAIKITQWREKQIIKVEKQRNGIVLGSSGLMLIFLLIFVLVIKK